MSEQDLKKIKKLTEGHRIEPRPEAWGRLQGMLKTKRAKRRLSTYRNISIAAILISVLSITLVFTMYLGKHNPSKFSSNENFRPIVLEELVEVDTDPFYDVKYIDQLNQAYTKIGF